jgi:hypothetical protein
MHEHEFIKAATSTFLAQQQQKRKNLTKRLEKEPHAIDCKKPLEITHQIECIRVLSDSQSHLSQ